MMPENKALLNAFQSVLVSWGDMDLTVPAFAAWRIRYKLQSQKIVAHGQRSVEPQPVPWRLSLATAETIDSVTQMAQLVSLMPEQIAVQTRSALSKSLTEFNDGIWCPTGIVWRWTFPRPKFDEAELFDQADLIVAASMFHAAAEVSSDELLASDFTGLADSFLKQAMLKQQIAPSEIAPRP